MIKLPFYLQLLYQFARSAFKMASRNPWPKYFHYLYVLLHMFAHFIATRTLKDRADKLPCCTVEEGKLQRGTDCPKKMCLAKQ